MALHTPRDALVAQRGEHAEQSAAALGELTDHPRPAPRGRSRAHGRVPTLRGPALRVDGPACRTPFPDAAIWYHIDVVGALQTVPQRELQGRVPAPHDQEVAAVPE